MGLSSNSYGDTDEIASLVLRFANNTSKQFDTTTRPTLARVESYTDQVSGIVNVVLSQYGFTIPISQADAKLALDLFVNQEVAAIVEGVNGLGRFGPTTKAGGSKGRWAIIMEDVSEFIEAYALGFERMGVARTYSLTSGLAYKATDEAGDAIFPLFSRKNEGNVPLNWDK